MIRNTERKIKVILYQDKKSDKNAVYTVRYYCAKCKNVLECNKPSDCNLAHYVRERLPQTEFVYNLDMPQLHIVIANDAEKQQAVRVLNRAQKLRTNRALIDRQK